jgi:hypothetical protein
VEITWVLVSCGEQLRWLGVFMVSHLLGFQVGVTGGLLQGPPAPEKLWIPWLQVTM